MKIRRPTNKELLEVAELPVEPKVFSIADYQTDVFLQVHYEADFILHSYCIRLNADETAIREVLWTSRTLGRWGSPSVILTDNVSMIDNNPKIQLVDMANNHHFL
tara:strand:+ start:227 stop:541 length:315 start_codon:yes stop_codon:yes gene_type:complete